MPSEKQDDLELRDQPEFRCFLVVAEPTIRYVRKHGA